MPKFYNISNRAVSIGDCSIREYLCLTNSLLLVNIITQLIKVGALIHMWTISRSIII